MPFIDEVLKYKSVSIVGMQKNTGKTECLNYILTRLNTTNKHIAITSIGTDGENIDQVSFTPKPEIEIFENTIFITTEKHYREKRILSEIIDISKNNTSLGRLITAKALNKGKVIISGPSNTNWLKKIIQSMNTLKIDLTLIDGALSRLSLASPAVSEAMILNTGAAVSTNKKQLIKKTKYLFDLINIPKYDLQLNENLINFENGIYAIDKQNNIHSLEIETAFLLEKLKEKIFMFGTTIFVAGVITDKLLSFLKIQKNISEITIIIRDFTRIFVASENYYEFIRRGGKVKVLLNTKLISICVNPTSPSGFKYNSKEICDDLHKVLKVPIYDIKQII